MSLQNLCFVNSSLQLLNSIREFREIFTSGSYKKYAIGKTPISNEMSRLFKYGGKGSTSASALRHLVASKSEQPPLSNGSQQDIVEFMEILIQEIFNSQFHFEIKLFTTRFIVHDTVKV